MIAHATISALLKRIGYCPYCGGEITPANFDNANAWLEWYPCRQEACPGNMANIVTDVHGFVIFPRAKERIYIYKRRYAKSRSGRNHAG